MIYIHKSIHRYFLGERKKSRVQNMEPFLFKIGSCNSWRCWENSSETWYKSVIFGCWFWNNRITCIRFSWSCTFFCIIYILEFKILSWIIWTIFLFLSNVTTLLFSLETIYPRNATHYSQTRFLMLFIQETRNIRILYLNTWDDA